jgi:hypothetical protein
MGCSDIFCILCGLPYSNYYLIENKIDKIEWIKKCTILTLDNKIIHNCENTDCYSAFENPSIGIEFQAYGYYQSKNLVEYPKYILGCFVHTDCWHFIKKEYNIELIYSMIPFISKMNKKISINHPILLSHIKYDIVNKYWQQDFNYKQLLLDKNEYLLTSPLDNKNKLCSKNISRIKKIFKQFNIKKTIRTGPQISATWYDDNIFRLGNDNNIWYTNKNKWIKLNETVSVIKLKIEYNKINDKDEQKLFNIINKIKQSGEPSENPIFLFNLYSFYDNKTKNNLISLNIIYTNNLLDKVITNISKLKKIKYITTS